MTMMPREKLLAKPEPALFTAKSIDVRRCAHRYA